MVLIALSELIVRYEPHNACVAANDAISVDIAVVAALCGIFVAAAHYYACNYER